MIKVRNLTKKYKINGQCQTIFKNLNLDIPMGKITIIRGESGCGKSTLLNIIASIDIEAEGEVIINNQNILKLNSSKRADFRNRLVGFVFQSHELIPEFSVLENTTIPLLLKNYSKSEAEREAKKSLEKLGISSTHFFKKPAQLSGGQQQRVSIARAIIHKPQIIFADEPTGNLDPKKRDEVIELIKSLKDEKRAIVIVTHDDEVEKIGDIVYYFRKGEDNQYNLICKNREAKKSLNE